MACTKRNLKRWKVQGVCVRTKWLFRGIEVEINIAKETLSPEMTSVLQS